MVGDGPLKLPSDYWSAKSLRILGVEWSLGRYEIFDWSYYDCLKRYGYRPNLANMISLHNEILESR